MAPTANTRINPEEALHLFRIPSSADLRELNHSYRRLVNKYHPDRNPGRETWAHQAMTKINAAYDIAVDYLGALRYEEIESQLDAEIKSHENFMAVFLNVANRAVDGFFTYYQYGLTNPHQRTSGTPRLRYRQAIKLITAAVQRLEGLRAPNQIDAETRDTFTRFASSFLQCMQIHRVNSPSSAKDEQLAYRHYREGSTALDNAIRRGFFREELSRPGEMASPQSLSVGENEYMAVLTRHSKSSWVVETVLKLQLLQRFSRLLELQERYEGLGL
jgi:hypothetical protein